MRGAAFDIAIVGVSLRGHPRSRYSTGEHTGSEGIVEWAILAMGGNIIRITPQNTQHPALRNRASERWNGGPSA